MRHGVRTGFLNAALFLVLAVFGAAFGQPNPAAETLVFFGDRDHEPYEFLENGKPRGASVELIEALGLQLGRKVEIRLLDWAESQSRLLAGEGHALTMLGRSPERELRYDFSRPVLPMSLSLFVRADEAQAFGQQKLAGRRIGVLAAGAPRLVLERQHPEAQLVVVADLKAGTQALLRHEIDALAAVTWVQLHQLHRSGITGVAAMTPFLDLQPSLAVRRGETALLAQIDAALGTLEANGEIDRIVDRWSGERIYTFTGLTLRMGQIAVIVAALALLGLSFAVLLLRRQRTRLSQEVRDREVAEAAAEQRAGEARILQRMATALAGATTPAEVGEELSRLVTLLPSLPQALLAKPRRDRPGWRLLVATARRDELTPRSNSELFASEAESALFDAAASRPGPLHFGSRSDLLSAVLESSRPLPSIESVVGEWFYVSALHPARRGPRQRPLGVLLLSWPAPPTGGNADGQGADRASLDSVAALVAQALERAQVHRAERRAAAQQSALREAASAFVAAADASAVSAVVSDVAYEHLGAVFAALAVLDVPPETGSAPGADAVMHLLHDRRMPRGLAEQFRQVRVDLSLPMSNAAREGRPIYIESRAALEASTPGLANWPHAAFVQAVAAVPLQAPAPAGAAPQGLAARLGAMTMHFDHPRRFDDEDRAFIETLAAMAARAIERCQLLERLQGSLARSEEAGLRTRLAMESNGMGSWDIDLATDRVEWSSRMYSLLGMPTGSGSEAMARFFDRVHPDDEQAVREAMEQAVAGNTDFDASFRVRAEEGTTRWLLGRGRTLQRRGASPATRMIGILFDITPMMQARVELETADRQKDEFLAMVSHELRNPLGPILNAATMLARAGERAEVREMAVPLIQRQIKQMTHLVDDLLELSRMRHGRIVLLREPVDALCAVQEALESVRPAIERLGHQVELRPAALAVRLDADPARLTQMLANLLGNAAKYTPPGGRITVEIGRERADGLQGEGEQGVLRISDNGVGIAEEFLPRLFDMFTQDRQSIDRADGGLGLGLALVKRLAELHGGSVEVASEGRGHGSCFTLRMPLAADR